MYAVSEVVKIDKAQNLILLTMKDEPGSDDIRDEQPFGEADFDE